MQAAIVFVVDEGLKNRDRRRLLFSSEYKNVGVCMLKDPTFGYKVTVDLSQLDLQCLNG